LGGVGTFGVVACVQEVTVTPGELLADADLIHYTMGASEKDEEEAIRKAVDFSVGEHVLVIRHRIDVQAGLAGVGLEPSGGGDLGAAMLLPGAGAN